MRRFLELIGVRQRADGRAVPLFRTWHTLAVIAVAAGLIVLVHRLA